jgi:hypothetical protein
MADGIFELLRHSKHEQLISKVEMGLSMTIFNHHYSPIDYLLSKLQINYQLNKLT